MSDRPPVAARFVPPASVTGMLARFSFWPLAFVGARAMTRAHPTLVTFLFILGTLIVSSVVARARRRAVVYGALAVGGSIAGVAAFAAARIALLALSMGPALALIASVAAAALFVRVHSERAEAKTLDHDALDLAPAAAWIALAALLARYGAEAVHLHIIVATATRAMAALALALALLAVFTLVAQTRWTRRLYRGDLPWIVGARPENVDTTPLLSRVSSSAVVTRAPGAKAPYRDDRPVLARVPSSEVALVARYVRASRVAVAATAAALTALVLSSGSLASAADSAATVAIPTTLAPLPGACADERPLIRFVALEPLALVDLNAVAERYRRLDIARVQVDRALPFEPRFLDESRGQLIGEELTRAARHAYRPRVGELVIVLTDRDMYLQQAPWRYAFAVGDGTLSVISIARMRTSFVWHPTQLDAPECTAVLRARMFKMITRAILRNACAASPSDDPRSVRRFSVLSLDDLDVLEEDVY